MPSYVNIGAHVAAGTMAAIWAAVGSCAQIGKNVHLSGGVGIGGVLEPAQGRPVMIGDECCQPPAPLDHLAVVPPPSRDQSTGPQAQQLQAQVVSIW